jgi:D-alanyl-D-alanine dipeptidase
MPVRFALLLVPSLLAAGAACGPSDTNPAAPPAPSVEAPAPPPAAPARLARADTLPEHFSYLRDVAPSILQEMRYTTAFNFVGAPIDGYEAATCILTTRAARALAAVQAEVERDGLSLKVYDCYRPQTAVDHFARWAANADETMKLAFYPEEPKSRLFARGYIARRSGHSRGSTVDLTLVALPHTPNTAYPDPAAGPLPRCDRPVGERFDERDLDMGTAYDCLSPVAATESGAVSAEARRNRYRLREVMSRHGFRNYAKEWWHFTLRDEPYRSTYFDFPVR